MSTADNAHFRTPVISVTDLYHPFQDPGDNIDLIAAYALPEVDLKAVVLDCTQTFRDPVSQPSDTALSVDRNGPRDPGIIPVCQLNAIFDRNVPYGAAPYRAMRTPEDRFDDAPRFQQRGIELIIETLEQTDEPVHIMSFGSARAIAGAYNRRPDLFDGGKAIIELSAGASSPDFREWNTGLDPHAIVRLLRSPLCVNIYPCATASGPFDAGTGNTFYRLPSLSFIEEMEPRLRRYLRYALGRVTRNDFLRAMEVDWECEEAAAHMAREHSVWETQLWMHVSNRALVRRAGERWAIAPRTSISASDEVLEQSLIPCRVNVFDDGRYQLHPLAATVQVAEEGGSLVVPQAKPGVTSAKRCYYRPHPALQEAAFAEALPDLYKSFAP
ncbi:MAG: hypothetical protein P4L33_18465 [Capsulimonadaceae bacterium]|nr:hypothetical protein [Capsulimonadaceae bacterium]